MVLIATAAYKTGHSQLPPCIDNNTGVITSGNINKSCAGTLQSNGSGIEYSGNVLVDYSSATQVHMIPGFHAGEFNGNNNFHASINNAASLTILTAANPSTGYYPQYEKVEFSLDLPVILADRRDYSYSTAQWFPSSPAVKTVEVSQDIADYLSDAIFPNPHTNPYDPDDIDIEVTFIHSSGNTCKTWAFYYQGFEYTPLQDPFAVDNLPETWTHISGSDGWRIRFAPPWTGSYSANVKITTYRGTANEHLVMLNNLTSFNVEASNNDGYLEFVNGSKYMSFKEDQSKAFVPIGNNLISDMDLNKYTSYPGEYYLNNEYVKNLNDRGNYARFSINVNGYWVEYDLPGNYQVHQAEMGELDKLINTAEENDVYLLMSLMIWEEFWAGEDLNESFPASSLGDFLSNDGTNETRDFFGEHPYRQPYQLGDQFATECGLIDDNCTQGTSNGAIV